jgi:hypothetical protein
MINCDNCGKLTCKSNLKRHKTSNACIKAGQLLKVSEIQGREAFLKKTNQILESNEDRDSEIEIPEPPKILKKAVDLQEREENTQDFLKIPTESLLVSDKFLKTLETLNVFNEINNKLNNLIDFNNNVLITNINKLNINNNELFDKLLKNDTSELINTNAKLINENNELTLKNKIIKKEFNDLYDENINLKKELTKIKDKLLQFYNKK